MNQQPQPGLLFPMGSNETITGHHNSYAPHVSIESNIRGVVYEDVCYPDSFLSHGDVHHSYEPYMNSPMSEGYPITPSNESEPHNSPFIQTAGFHLDPRFTGWDGNLFQPPHSPYSVVKQELPVEVIPGVQYHQWGDDLQTPHSPDMITPSLTHSPASYQSSLCNFTPSPPPSSTIDLPILSSRSKRSKEDKSEPKACSHCSATSTPLWRREPVTLRPLCNACGLYLQQRHKLRPKELIEADAAEAEEEVYDPSYTGPECSHCHTRNTSVWRRSKSGAQLCNACGVYQRLRGKDRPLTLRRNRVKPRTKHNKSS